MHISLIIPVCNAGSFLAGSLSQIDNYLKQFGKPLELILVDDGSSDSSGKILAGFAGQDHNYPVIHLTNEKNMGKGFSVARGMLAAKGDFRIFTDCDLAYPPSEIDKILQSLEKGFDLAIACRVDKMSHYTISPAFFRYLYTRHIASRFLNLLLRKTLLPFCRDSQAGLKGFTAKAAETIFSQQKIKGFSFDIEVLYIADQLGMMVEEVAVNYSYFDEPTTIKFMGDSIHVLKDIIALKLACHPRESGDLIHLNALDPSAKLLIINADDFGLSEDTNLGIIDSYKNGAVRSISIMPNGLITDLPDLDIGIHFTLTHGRPVSEPSAVPSLVDNKGSFYPLKIFCLKLFAGSINFNEVKTELSAQFNILKNRKVSISHINSHHHVHIFPGIRDIVAKIAKEHGVKYVRSLFPNIDNSATSLKKLFVARINGAYRQFWAKKGIKTADYFAGFGFRGDKNLLERWKQFLLKLPPGITEVMVHPGASGCPTLRQGSGHALVGENYKEGRQIELEVLKSAELADICQKENIQLTGFADLLT